MAVNLTAETTERGTPRFPYSNWGPGVAILGLFAALGLQLVLGNVVFLVDGPSDDDLSTTGTVIIQALVAAIFIAVPLFIAKSRDASTWTALRRLGVRRFGRSAPAWMAAAVGAYLLFAIFYTAVFGEPKQQDIAEGFGPLPIQILLIAIAAPISEELFFRGMLFGGLRERLPLVAAALISGLVFGGLHALTGLSAVPPLIAFGFIMALLYERTGSIVPGILLHMINNSAALAVQ
jgi:membrane protease YdiL (CAAX protease family)